MPRLPRPARRARLAAMAIALAALAALAACSDSSIEPQLLLGDRCPQTYEFSNVGCAQLTVLLDASSVQPPSSYLLFVGVRPMTADPSSAHVTSYASPAAGTPNPPLDRPVTVQVTFWGPVPEGDTLAAWVVARVQQDTIVGVNRPLPTVAVDSARYTLRRTPVGDVVPADTLRLTLRQP